MRIIKKYKLAATADPQILNIPYEYRIIHVGESHGDIFIWCEQPLDGHLHEVVFELYATDHTLKDSAQYVGSVQSRAGYVWHIYNHMD